MDRARFNALEFFPDHPDEMGLWPEGVVAPAGDWGGLVGGRRE